MKKTVGFILDHQDEVQGKDSLLLMMIYAALALAKRMKVSIRTDELMGFIKKALENGPRFQHLDSALRGHDTDKISVIIK